MGLPVEVNNLLLGGARAYTISRSLRFRSSASAYLNRTPASAGNQQKWTWSGWVKRGALSYIHPFLFSCYQDDNNRTVIGWYNSDQFAVYNIDAASVNLNLVTTAVYRDPSAWYHIVIAIDTTQATASNRAIIYVNGQQVTALSTATYPSQNTSLYMNSARQHRIASSPESSPKYFDGYMAEINFIDGQALTPSSFGETDLNGIWQPKKYAGTYGTNGFYLPFNWSTNTSYAGSFNGSTQYLTVPTNTAFDFGSGDWTIEAWVLTDSTTNRNIVAREYAGSGTNYTGYILSTTQFVASTADGAWQVNFTWSLPSANQWHHYAAVRNGNVFSVYIDGIRVGTQTVAGTLLNGYGGAFTIGYRNGQSLPSGSMSNLRVVKGTAVYTSNFTPPTSALTAISGTSLLTLQSSTVIDNSTNAFTITNVGSVAMAASSPFGASVLADASGNNNGWSGNNINYSAYGTTYDSMIDSPTVSASSSNYCVFNPIDKGSNLVVANANLNISIGGTGGNDIGRATMAFPTSGKWYLEMTVAAVGAGVHIGLATASVVLNSGSGTFTGIWYNQDGTKTTSWGTNVAYGATYTTGDVIGVAYDSGANSVTFYKNNASQGAATPSSTGAEYFPAVFLQTTANVNLNFGQRPFSYTPPTGFNALNTYNLPAPSIANGAQYMAATVFSASGSSQTVTNTVNNASFQTDFLWLKNRTSAGNHYLADVIRGPSNLLYSDSTSAEGSAPSFITSFNSNGFTINTNGVYTNGNSIVGWQWKGGGAAVTNNSGTISSQVSANASAGFSIVTYTGTGANATVGHGLGVAPSMVIVKQRSGANAWPVYHISQTSAAYYMLLNQTDASNIAATVWNSTAPTSSVFSIGTAVGVNTSGQTYVAYCFSAVSGYSAFGKYTGNGSADGPFIYTGFRPRYVLIKNTQDGTTNWYIYDSSRDTYNILSNYLMTNLSNAEASFSPMDFLSNGFKLRTTNLNFNNSGQTHIYMAFAENPFNYSRAR